MMTLEKLTAFALYASFIFTVLPPSAFADNENWKIDNIKIDGEEKQLRYAIYSETKDHSLITKYVVLINGRSEWIEKLMHVPAKLSLPTGTAFLTWDHRGQGESFGKKAHVESYDDYIDDAKLIISNVVGSKPYVLIGHSMGGLIALYGTMNESLKPQSIVLTAPLFLMPSGVISRFFTRSVSRFSCIVGFCDSSLLDIDYEALKFKDNGITHSQERFDQIRYTPYPIPLPTFSWIKATFTASDFIFDENNIKKINVPVLIISASEDKIVDIAGHALWVNKRLAYSPDFCKLVDIHGAYHDLFVEKDEYLDKVISYTQDWLKDFYGKDY